jgi:nicotinamide-nucleotide amidase
VTDLAPLVPLAAEVIAEGTRRKLKIAAAESCTGGLVAAALTEVAGSSAVVERAFVTYSNDAKSEMLGVPVAVLAAHGAVSREVAIAMAEGALAHSSADVAVAVTGVAGPTGGSAAKPVGLVHFATARRGQPTRHVERRFKDDGRAAIRLAAAREALSLLRGLLSSA